MNKGDVVFEQVAGGSEVMLKPGLNIIGGVHPFGFKGPIACMLDIGFADDMGGMLDPEGTFDVADDSDAILDIVSTVAIGLVAVETLLSGMEPVIGPFIDIGDMEIIEDVDSGLLLSGMETAIAWLIDMGGIEDSGLGDLRIIVPAEEPLIGLFVDVSGVALAIDIFGSFIDIPCIAAVDDILVLPVTIPDIPGIPISSPRPTPAWRMDSGRHSTFPYPFARILSTQNGNAPVLKYWE